jgi:hypothetical protein
MKFGAIAGLLLSISVALLSCSKTNKSDARSLLDAKIKCTKEGNEWLERQKKEFGVVGGSVFGAQFQYNESFDTCLSFYHITSILADVSKATDILSEKDILTFKTKTRMKDDALGGIDNRPGATPVRDLEDFKSRVRALGFAPST